MTAGWRISRRPLIAAWPGVVAGGFLPAQECVLVFLILAAVGTAGCSSDELIGGGRIERTSYPPVTAQAPSKVPTSPDLPAAFPRDIPVVKGCYSVGEDRFGNGPTLEVRDFGQATMQSAGDLLIAAGYDRQQVLGMDVYIGTKYAVILGAGDLAGEPVLSYRVSSFADLPGMPKIPELKIPDLLSGRNSARATTDAG
ncbi:hypothetical protein [Mycolicibacter minnesotensis]